MGILRSIFGKRSVSPAEFEVEEEPPHSPGGEEEGARVEEHAEEEHEEEDEEEANEEEVEEQVDLSQYVENGELLNFVLNRNAMVEALTRKNNLPVNTDFHDLPVGAAKHAVGQFHPVHRVTLETFEKILICGSLQSASFRDSIKLGSAEAHEALCTQLRADLRLRALIAGAREPSRYFRFLEKVAAKKLLVLQGLAGTPAAAQVAKDIAASEDEIVAAAGGWLSWKADEVGDRLALSRYTCCPPPGPQGEQPEARKAKKLLQSLRQRAAEHAKNIHDSMGGDKRRHNVAKDSQLGTNKKVFSIVGPNRGHRLYGPICIVLKQAIMYHPDFDITPCAGTSYLPPDRNALKFNTWLECKKYALADDDKRDEHRFHMSRLNAGIPGWRSAMATALAHAVTVRVKEGGRQLELKDVTEDDILDHYKENPHCVLEGHLPGIVPLRLYAYKVIIPTEQFDQLIEVEKERLSELVGDNVEVVESTEEDAEVIIENCYRKLKEEPQRGFHLHLLPGTTAAAKVLRGVQPKQADEASVRLKIRGPGQLLLGPGPQSKADNGVVFAFYSPPKGASLNEPGFLKMAEQDFTQPKKHEVKEGKIQCCVASQGSLSTFLLQKGEDGFLHCSIRVGRGPLSVRDISAGVTKGEENVLSVPVGAVCVKRVAVKLGQHEEEVEVKDLQIK